MGLIRCTACRNQISDQATACPKCGHPHTPAPAPVTKPGLVIPNWVVLGAIALAVIALSIAGDNSGVAPPPASAVTSKPAEAEKPDSVTEAMVVCKAMENTGMTTRCEVKGWGKTVDVRMDTSSAEARKMCGGIAQEMQQIGNELRRTGWKLRIFSPYSGEEPIAVCNF